MPDLTLSLGTNVLRHLHGDEGIRLGTLADLAGSRSILEGVLAQLGDTAVAPRTRQAGRRKGP